MKNRFRIGSLVIVLGLLGLLGGCASQSDGYGQRVRQARDFEVVETSTKRELTPREMEHLRAKVADYLEQEGVTDTGDYYVKIYLGEEPGVAEGEWVVVRYTRYPATRVELVSSYPDYYDDRSTYAYDYYPLSPYGPYGFSRLSFQYYDYPYYGHGYYPPFRRLYHGPGRGHHGQRPKPDDDKDPGPRDGRPSGALKPSFKPTFVPANVAAPQPSGAPALTDRSRDNLFPRRYDPRQRSNRDIVPGGAAPAPRIRPNTALKPSFTPTVPPGVGTNTLRAPRIAPNPAAERAVQRYNRPAGVAPDARATGARERQYAPVNPGSSAREAPTVTRPRAAPSGALKPSATPAQSAPARSAPAVRAESAPVYTAPATRSDSEPASTPRINVNDGGRRARER